MSKRGIAAGCLSGLLAAGVALAATPPDLLNYEGVLRDSMGQPISGDYVMVFRLIDGNQQDEILVDQHGDAAGGVPVTGGVFNIQIGGGVVTDGSGPGTYTSLSAVFRDHENVLLRVEVGGEVLSPDVRLLSAAYAHNASYLGGLHDSQFLRSDQNDTSVGNLFLAGNPSGSFISQGLLYISPNAVDPDDTLLGIAVSAQERFRVDAEGDTTVGGDLTVAGNEVVFGEPGTAIRADPGSLTLQAGDADGDDLILSAGNSASDGRIAILGDGEMELRSGDGVFQFRNAAGVGIARLIGTGDLNLSADLIIGSASNSDDDVLFFDGTNQWLRWDDSDGDFDLNSGLSVDGPLEVSQFVSSSGQTHEIVADHAVAIDTEDSQILYAAEWYHQQLFVNSLQLAELQEDGDFLIRGTLSQSVSFDVAEAFLSGEAIEPGDLVRVDPSRGDRVRLSAGAGDPGVLGVVSTRPGVLLGSAPFDTAALRQAWGDEVHREFEAAHDRLRGEILAAQPELERRLAALDVPATAEGEKPESLAVRALRSRLEKQCLERFFEERLVPVALAGRVPVKVDGAYGAIEPGDALAPSPVPGVAMKAQAPGMVIGTALEAFAGDRGMVLAFVDRSFWAPTGTSFLPGATPASTTAAIPDRPAAPTPGPAASIVEARGISPAAPSPGPQRTTEIDDGTAQVDDTDVHGRDGQSVGIDIEGDPPVAREAHGERIPVSEAVEAGDVLVLDPERPGALRVGARLADPTVAGIAVSHGTDDARVAFSGMVTCKADAGYGAIRVGDLLTVSPTAGHAMRVLDPSPGTLIGKAVEPLAVGTGSIRVLVTLR